MAETRLAQLRAEEIGWTFGRSSALLDKLPLSGRLNPIWRSLLVGVLGTFALLVGAQVAGVLVRSPGAESPWTLFLSGTSGVPRRVELPLLQDPVGIVSMFVTLATPLFCAIQVGAIHGIVQMNERNVEVAMSREGLGLTVDEPMLTREFKDVVNELIETANRRFAVIGRARSSLAIAAASFVCTLVLYRVLLGSGIMRSWNPTTMPDGRWRTAVLDGWWANIDEHRSLALALCALGWYMFYFLFKQLLMGWVFARFAHEALESGFGVTPNLTYDSDGYAGLRQLRRFMLWTYGSSLAHFIITVGVLVVWLPATPYSLFLCLAIMITNGTVVIYPSSVAYRATIHQKQLFVEKIIRSSMAADQKEAMIARVWATPNLPFRTRSTLTAITIYLLFPLMLAIVSAIFTGD